VIRTTVAGRLGGDSFHLAQKFKPMRIPHRQLTSAALRAVVEEYVTRDGTDHSSVEERIVLLLCQLDAGNVELHFEQATETCNILPRNEGGHPSGENPTTGH
jgi:hypothetical protein